jgi:hypothetical protein
MTQKLINAIKFARAQQLNQHHALKEMHKNIHESLSSDPDTHVEKVIRDTRTMLELEQAYATEAE